MTVLDGWFKVESKRFRVKCNFYTHHLIPLQASSPDFMETAGYEVASATGPPVDSAHPNLPKRRHPRQARDTPQPPGGAAQTRPPRRPRPPQNPSDASAPTAGSSNPTRDGSQPRNARRMETPTPTSADGTPARREGNRRKAAFGAGLTQSDAAETRKQTPMPTSADGTAAPQPRREGNRRKAAFGAGLTQSDAAETQNAPATQPAKKRIPRPPPHPDSKPSETPSKPTAGSSKAQGKGRAKNLPQGDDLTSILIRDLSTPPYPDCPICFSAIRPEQAIWSCSPSIAIVTSSDAQVPQYCWTSFHVKCIRSWAEKSVKEVADAWRARGESDKKGDWRCPGCQAKRETVPSGYWCFCHSTSEPKPLRLSTPHSCGNSCSRPRESGCGHPCPLQCHPGPCPPCQVTTRLECYCPKKNILTFRCGIDARSGTRNLTCSKVCERTLNCGKHTCNKICHAGECNKCDVVETVKCYCGKEEKTVTCGEGREIQCFVEGETPWLGRFTCDNVCDRPFDCGKHRCQKPCHPPSSQPAVCPRAPSQITHCPCGKHTVAPSPSADASQYTFPARADCTAPIPTCGAVCAKPHPACAHPCTALCHTGPCPPCTVQIVRPCRCGATTKSAPCYAVLQASAAGVAETELLCDRPCVVLRACGRHQCRRVCCPLAALAATARKGKKRGVQVEDGQGLGEEQGGLHECDLVCGKPLSCGNHRCERREHKGACPPCLQSSFEELVCACGRTVYEPPIPCGTRMECHYPCARPLPACGHSGTPHSCHDAATPCPPCVHLASKRCACGKRVMPNVRCSLETEKVSCGTVCGRLMGCGFHHCERLCHGDECGPCAAPCGKARKSCLPEVHPCTLPCHAPSSCPETDRCQSLITLTCPCGRIRQAVHCGKSLTSRGAATSQSASPKCTSECQIAKRNARLADALGINTEGRGGAPGLVAATYNDEVVAFARANPKFLPVVERAFADFVTSEKRTQVLPHMPQDRRKFVHDLAAIYRMDTQMVDQEPHRSVQLLRRVDTRIPTPLLSTHISSAPSLGKLADFRNIRSTQAPSWRALGTSTTPAPRPQSAGASTSSAAANSRGWTSVVAKSTTPTPTPPPALANPRPATTLGGTSAASLTARHASPAGSVAQTPLPSVAAANEEPVPDNWDDDA